MKGKASLPGDACAVKSHDVLGRRVARAERRPSGLRVCKYQSSQTRRNERAHHLLGDCGGEIRRPANIILAVAEIEGGKPGRYVENTNGTYDVGTMQFNTAYLHELAKYGISAKDVAASGCYSYDLAAWRLRGHILNDTGDLWTRAANYHSKTPCYNAEYRAKLIRASEKWGNWLAERFKTQDMLAGYKTSDNCEKFSTLVGIVFLVFSLFRSRGRFVLVYNMSARELYLWWLMRLILMIVALVILYFLFPQHGQLGQKISLLFHSVYSIFRDFVDRLLRHIPKQVRLET